MKTITNRSDRTLRFFLAFAFLMFAVKIAGAQNNAKDIIKVKINGNGYSDETFIRFKDGASVSFESDKDSWKMFSMNPGVPMIFTKVDGYAMALNTFPRLENKNKMELYTKIQVAGNYSLETKIISPFADSVKIFLIDKLMNEIYNIREDSSINVSLSADSGNTSRFQLYFSTPVKHSGKKLTCFKNKDGQILLENLNQDGWQADIVDENGIFNKSISGTSESFLVTNLHGGNYLTTVQDFSGSENFEIKVDQPYPVISIFEKTDETVCLCDGGAVTFINNSIGASGYSWLFGDGTKSTEFGGEHIYSQPGNYIVSLSVSAGECRDTSYSMIKVVENSALSVPEVELEKEGTLYFDGEKYIFKTNDISLQNLDLEVFNMVGQKMQYFINPDLSEDKLRINLVGKRNQLYIFNFKTQDTSFTKLAL